MLDGARDADGDVELGGDDLASLADLHVVGDVAGVNSGTGGANAGTELVGQGVEHLLEVVRGLQRTAAGNNLKIAKNLQFFSLPLVPKQALVGQTW